MPHEQSIFSENNIRNFWKKVEILGANDCWDWTASSQVWKNEKRGWFNFEGKSRQSHRVAAMIFYNRRLPTNVIVRHKCDRPICCNPNHLVLGNLKENTQDMWDRKREGKSICAVNKNKTHCCNGHEFTPENLYNNKLGHRTCGICAKERSRKWRQKIGT